MPLNLYFSLLLNLFRSPFSALVKQNSESTLMLHSSKSPENVFSFNTWQSFSNVEIGPSFYQTISSYMTRPPLLDIPFLLFPSTYNLDLLALHRIPPFLDNKISVAFCKALARMLLPKFTLGPAQFGPWHIFQFFTS